jgi:hypothetical protein
MDAVFLELQIQICVGETIGTPMLLGNDFARLRLELAANLAAPTCHIRRTFATRLPSEPAQCTSRSRSRQGDIDDAAHRRREAPPSAQHSGLATYEEHNHLLLQQSSSGPHNLPPSEMKSFYGSIMRSAVISLSNFRFAMLFPPMRLPKLKVRFVACERQPAESLVP